MDTPDFHALLARDPAEVLAEALAEGRTKRADILRGHVADVRPGVDGDGNSWGP